MSYRLIVDSPTGEQQEIPIDESGSYFDESRVVWDERKDKPLPKDYVIGKLARGTTGGVYQLPDFIPEHTEYTEKLAKISQDESRKIEIALEVEGDTDFKRLRAMTDTEIDAEIDIWFDSLLSKGKIEGMFKKAIKTLVKQNIL